MKYIRKLVVLILAVILGFWLASTNALQNTMVGNWLDTIVRFIPAPDDWSNLSLQNPEQLVKRFAPEEQPNESQVSSVTQERSSDLEYNVVETRILTLLNALREEKQVSTLTSNETLREVANIRAIETETLFSHTRPDGSDTFSVFEEEGISYPYTIVGENLGMATNYLDETAMAELLFNGWVESEGHYENMIRPEFQEVGIGVHYDGEFLYATQIFGTPQ